MRNTIIFEFTRFQCKNHTAPPRPASVNHGVRFEKYYADIMEHILSDVDEVPQPLLDAILGSLLEPKRTNNPAAYALGRSVIQRCGAVLNKPIHGFLLSCLPCSASSCESELRSEWPELVREVTAASVEPVAYLLPQLEEVVAVDNEDVRAQGTRLLAQLFSIPTRDVNVPREFPQLRAVFASKFHDCSVAVRCTAVVEGVRLVAVQPALADELVGLLKERLQDPDDKVRATLVSAVCEACAERIGPYGPILEGLPSRMSDKKATTRSVARTELCSLYRKHLSTRLTGDVAVEVDMPEELARVPTAVMQAYGANFKSDLETRQELETILDSKILPSDADMRLQALCVIHRTLTDPQRAAFKALLRTKRTAQYARGNPNPTRRPLACPPSTPLPTRLVTCGERGERS